MTETKPNREQRRHPEKVGRPEDESITRAADTQDEALRQGSPDIPDGKPTADKWNQ